MVDLEEVHGVAFVEETLIPAVGYADDEADEVGWRGVEAAVEDAGLGDTSCAVDEGVKELGGLSPWDASGRDAIGATVLIGGRVAAGGAMRMR